MVLTDGFQEFDAVQSGHVEIRDHAVNIALSNPVKSVARVRRRYDLQSVVLPRDELGGHLHEVRFVVDMQNGNGARGVLEHGS